MSKTVMRDANGKILTDKQEKNVFVSQLYNYTDFDIAEIAQPDPVEVLKQEMNRLIRIADSFDKLVREKKLENEQFFLDWQDELNEISVR